MYLNIAYLFGMSNFIFDPPEVTSTTKYWVLLGVLDSGFPFGENKEKTPDELNHRGSDTQHPKLGDFDCLGFDFANVNVAHFAAGTERAGDEAEPAGVGFVVVSLPFLQDFPGPAVALPDFIRIVLGAHFGTLILGFGCGFVCCCCCIHILTILLVCCLSNFISILL